jgi:hypothetical protein
VLVRWKGEPVSSATWEDKAGRRGGERCHVRHSLHQAEART